MADEYTRPLPVKQPESDFYWERAQGPRAMAAPVQRV